MIKTTLATNFIIETEIDEKEFKYKCELLDEKRSVWECEFPRKMSLFDISKAIEELFFECDDLCPEIIKFNFNGTEIISKNNGEFCALEEIAMQLKVR